MYINLMLYLLCISVIVILFSALDPRKTARFHKPRRGVPVLPTVFEFSACQHSKILPGSLPSILCALQQSYGKLPTSDS
jgi:hypothetical protein